MLQEVIFHNDKLILQNELEIKGYKIFSDKNWLMEKGGLVVLSKNFELKNMKFIKFFHQGPVDLISIPDKILGKGFQTFTLLIEGKKILLVNAHLVCPYANKEKEVVSQQKQFSQLIDFVNSQKKDISIVCGDLNSLPDSKEIAKLKSECDLVDSLGLDSYTVDPKNLNRGWIMNMFGDGNKYRPDYTLVSSNIKIIESRIMFEKTKLVLKKEIHMSDHFGILTTINI